jgi:hypothetical protein
MALVVLSEVVMIVTNLSGICKWIVAPAIRRVAGSRLMALGECDTSHTVTEVDTFAHHGIIGLRAHVVLGVRVAVVALGAIGFLHKWALASRVIACANAFILVGRRRANHVRT